MRVWLFTNKGLDKKFLICLILIIAACYVNYKAQRTNSISLELKAESFPFEINGWLGTDLFLDESAINLIQPDMFLFRNYERGDEKINVFIGYYETLTKSDLSHSPLVCYPGSGWIINEKKKIQIEVNGEDLHFTQLILEKGASRELVIYGYKSKNLMTNSLLKYRVHLIRQNFMEGMSNGAFVRFSTKIHNNDERKALSIIGKYLNGFNIYFDKAIKNAELKINATQ